MQVVPLGGQICDWCQWRYLVAKFVANVSGSSWWPNFQLHTSSGAIWWPNFWPLHMAPPGGHFWTHYKWRHLKAKIGSDVSPFWAKISSVMDTSAPHFGQHNPNLKTYDPEQCQKV